MTTLDPVIQTTSGPVRGEATDGVLRFLGVSYAAGIAGALRFLPPRPPEPWTEPRDARRRGSISPQPPAFGSTPVSVAFRSATEPGDDCLNLNIWAPAASGKRMPVMVWLHGGGWTAESANGPIYDGAHLAGRHDVVVVGVNHRLGASGLTDFSRVVGGEFAGSSNLAVRDLIAALEWVRDNIAAVGGDPDLVTIFGGGWKVATLLGVPSAAGLFHRAIIESGPLTRFLTPAEADDLALAVLGELGLTPQTRIRE